MGIGTAENTETEALSELRRKIACLYPIGSERPVTSENSVAIRDEIAQVLTDPDFSQLSLTERTQVLWHLLIIYSSSWDAIATTLIPLIEPVSQTLFKDDEASLSTLCTAYDLLYFLYWCGYNAIDDQIGFGTNVVTPFCKAIARRHEAEIVAKGITYAPDPIDNSSTQIAYLAEFISPGPGNAIAGASNVLLKALASITSKQTPPILYAWLFHDEKTLAAYAALGITVKVIEGNSIEEKMACLRAYIKDDKPRILLTDMNASFPAAAFQYRVAPIQVFYQFGLPVWPVPNVDAVLHTWAFDFEKAGLADRPHTLMTIPYDLAPFAREARPEDLQHERARLPSGRLMGCYGRLSKITPEFIETVAAAIQGHTDITVVIGGSGDGTNIRTQVQKLGLADRIVIIEGYVDGHVWGHLLDIFLDTFPVPGGASCLEVIAKGKPIISLGTSEAANLNKTQRVKSLVAKDTAHYTQIIKRLITNPDDYERACSETRKLAHKYQIDTSFETRLKKALLGLINKDLPWYERLLGKGKKQLD